MRKSPSVAAIPRLAFSREGWLFVFFLLALACSAIYSGKSGLMLLFCSLFSALVIFFMQAKRNFSQPLSIERRFVEEIFAGRDTRIDVIVTNQGKDPIYGVHIFEQFEDGSEIGPMYVRKLSPGESAIARYMCRFPNRGNAHFCGFEVRSRFPLPFFELRREIVSEMDVLVYPEPIPETHLIELELGASENAPERIHYRNTKIREIVHGRKSGRILWKHSARRRKWIEEARMPCRMRSGTPVIVVGDKDRMGTEKFEAQISQITAFVLREIQHDMSGIIRTGHTEHLYGKSPQQRREILETLATV